VNSNNAVAEINLKALSHNLGVVRKKTGGINVLAVVKANAYGHGAVPAAKHLIQKGVSSLGVAFTSEAVILREAGITCPILVFFDRNNIVDLFDYNLTPVVFDVITAKEISRAAYKRNTLIPIHIKIDTGMGRVGFTLKKALKEIVKIAGMKNIKIEGLMSHFSEADLQDKQFANQQVTSFLGLVNELKKSRVQFQHLHISNSAAVMTMPDAHFNMVRPGIMLYGYAFPGVKGLKPVLSLKSKIVLLKKVAKGTPISYGRTFITKRSSLIATIPVGYADGYSRQLSNKGEVLINGHRAPVAGRVCMDTIMADVTDVANVSYESEVVLIGRQGKEKIMADDIADKIGTIPYEVLTSIGQRVSRIYT
jgi:alanine racemase